MNGQLLQSNCAPARPARWTFDVSATLAAMAIAVVVASLITVAGNGTATASTSATPTVFSRLADIPSHSGTYRASLVPSSDAAGQSDRLDSPVWIVTVETAAGTPVDDATLSLESWMPDDDRMPATRASVTRALGAGRYRVEGLRLDRRGWWNVRMQIAGLGATDSLAFNLVR